MTTDNLIVPLSVLGLEGEKEGAGEEGTEGQKENEGEKKEEEEEGKSLSQTSPEDQAEVS